MISAQLPESFPNTFHPEDEPWTVNLSVFQYDLRLHVVIWLLNDDINYLLQVETMAFPIGSIHEYEIVANICKVNNPKSIEKLGSTLPKYLGMLLEQNYLKDQAASADQDISEITQSFEKISGPTSSSSSGGSKGGKKKSRKRSNSYSSPLDYWTSIRPNLLIGEDNKFTVLSCIRWSSMSGDDIMLNRIRFVLTESEFERNKYFYVSLLRTDSWNCVGRPICLGAARVMGDGYD